MDTKMESVYERAKPYLLSVFVNMFNAGYNIFSKMAMEKGMSPFVLVLYAQVVGTIATALLTLIFERTSRPKFNPQIWLDIFFLGILVTSVRILHYTGLQRTTCTFTSSIIMLFPTVTFILAVLFRMERLEMKKVRSQAKVVGTLVAFGGATLMTLYKGIIVIPAISGHHSHSSMHRQSPTIEKGWVIGGLMVLGAASFRAGFSILQTVTIKKYPAPFSLTFLVCLVGAFQTAAVTWAIDHKPSDWKLGWNIRLFSALYCGTLVFGVSIYMTFLVIRKRGPVFSSAFTPLATIVVAVMDLLILQHSLHLGSALGAILIVGGLYMVLWGKSKDAETKPLKDPSHDSNQNQRQSAQEAKI